MKRLKQFYRNNNGQSLVLFMLFFTIFLGIIGLSIDTSWVILNKWKIQNAADFSAISGAQFLPLNTSDAYTTADDVFQQNYENTVTNSDISFSNSNYSINVDYEDSVDLFFLSLFGFDKVSIEGKSEAEVAPVYKPAYIIPIALNSNNINIIYDKEITLIGDIVNPTRGNFGLIDPTSDGSMQNNDLEDYIENNYTDEGDMPTAGGDCYTKTGDLKSLINDAIAVRLSNGKTNAIVAIVDFSNATGTSEKVPVLGFASFEIISCEKTSDGFELVVKFIEFISSDSIGKNGITYYGAKVVRLVS
jgi:hypothetical protein